MWLTRGLVVWLGVLWSVGLASAAPHVITTIAPITDMIDQVGGKVIHVHGLIPAGVNAHTFQPTPHDVRLLSEADAVILNGLALEIPIEKIVRRVGKPDVRILKLGDKTLDQDAWIFDRSFPKAHGHPNPHLWLNVVHAMTYTELIRDQLSALAPNHRQVFQHQARRYHAHLERLDQCLATAISTIQNEHRKLLTYHDSWPYFARRYGMTVIGAVQPASFMEPSPREIARVIDQIRRDKVPAIFGSAVFPSPVLAKITAETGVRYVDALRDDTLPGPPGTAEHSYIGLMLTNVHAIVAALGGDPTPLKPCWIELIGKPH
jgi:ABC-type Zn uptake system ZnuABC Zn-binding protein ZnuA